MRDITITSKIIKRELLILLACFLAAILINIAAIIAYHTFWIELITQIGYELVIALVLYVLVWIIRGLIFLLIKLPYKNLRRQ